MRSNGAYHTIACLPDRTSHRLRAHASLHHAHMRHRSLSAAAHDRMSGVPAPQPRRDRHITQPRHFFRRSQGCRDCFPTRAVEEQEVAAGTGARWASRSNSERTTQPSLTRQPHRKPHVARLSHRSHGSSQRTGETRVQREDEDRRGEKSRKERGAAEHTTVQVPAKAARRGAHVREDAQRQTRP